MPRLRYIRKAVLNAVSPLQSVCPNCGHSESVSIQRKRLVFALRRCRSCWLMYRAPTSDPADSKRFYNDEYQQGFTTEMPSEPSLRRLIASDFAGEKDYSAYVEALHFLGARPGEKLFDFGCSWGYGSFQLKRAGFDVIAYDISVPRSRFAAQELGVRLVGDLQEWSAEMPSIDIFFSAHVLEHVPAPKEVFDLAFSILKPGGLFVGFFPNGSTQCYLSYPDWRNKWGRLHPNFIDDVFLNRAFAGLPRAFASSPLSVSGSPAAEFLRDGGDFSIALDDLTGIELMFAARMRKP